MLSHWGEDELSKTIRLIDEGREENERAKKKEEKVSNEANEIQKKNVRRFRGEEKNEKTKLRSAPLRRFFLSRFSFLSSFAGDSSPRRVVRSVMTPKSYRTLETIYEVDEEPNSTDDRPSATTTTTTTTTNVP